MCVITLASLGLKVKDIRPGEGLGLSIDWRFFVVSVVGAAKATAAAESSACVRGSVVVTRSV